MLYCLVGNVGLGESCSLASSPKFCIVQYRVLQSDGTILTCDHMMSCDHITRLI